MSGSTDTNRSRVLFRNGGSASERLFRLADRDIARDRKSGAGFMPPAPFTTEQELTAYLSGPLLQCLVCGQWRENVGTHLKAHGVSAREYRERFNIPRTYPLCSGVVSERLSFAQLDAMHKNPDLSEFRRTIHHTSTARRGVARSSGYTMLTDSRKPVRECVVCRVSFAPAHPAIQCCSKRCAGKKGAATRQGRTE
jgi:hypothetical protein